MDKQTNGYYFFWVGVFAEGKECFILQFRTEPTSYYKRQNMQKIEVWSEKMVSFLGFLSQSAIFG